MQRLAAALFVLAASCATAPRPAPQVSGFDLDRSLPPDLRHYERADDEHPQFDESVAVRRVRFTLHEEEITVLIVVGQRSPQEARKALAELIGGRALVRDESTRLGDEALVATPPLPLAGELGFIRSNIAIWITGRNATPSLVDLARDFDRLIEEAGPGSPPVVEYFGFAGEGSDIKAHTLRAVSLRMRDTETPAEDLILRFPASTNHVVVSLGGRYAVLAADPGEDRVRLYVVNRRLLTASASFPIRVIE